jgi:hypothetical protein
MCKYYSVTHRNLQGKTNDRGLMTSVDWLRLLVLGVISRSICCVLCSSRNQFDNRDILGQIGATNRRLGNLYQMSLVSNGGIEIVKSETCVHPQE